MAGVYPASCISGSHALAPQLQPPAPRVLQPRLQLNSTCQEGSRRIVRRASAVQWTKSCHWGNQPVLQRVAALGVPRVTPHFRAARPVAAGLRDWRSNGSSWDGDASRGSGGLDPSARWRLERSWTIQKQPVPVACEGCGTEGVRECEWCRGSGYFVLGDQLLCEVPSRNTQCLICHGHGSVRCNDCLGTGFRARWLEPVVKKE